jgi:putative endonuclease
MMGNTINNMYYVYILKSKLDNKLYTGFSSNLKKRISEHNSGGVVSTKNRRPLELIYYEAYKEKVNALKREKFLKTTRGKSQLKKQIII